jgi:hypothetical protein
MWYAAHAILYIAFKDGNQDSFPIWENVYLIAAADEEEAWRVAKQRAHEDEGDSEGSLTSNGRPAEWRFAGIRKLITVSHISESGTDDDQPVHGAEITYSEFEVTTAAELETLVAGDSLLIHYHL